MGYPGFSAGASVDRWSKGLEDSPRRCHHTPGDLPTCCIYIGSGQVGRCLGRERGAIIGSPEAANFEQRCAISGTHEAVMLHRPLRKMPQPCHEKREEKQMWPSDNSCAANGVWGGATRCVWFRTKKGTTCPGFSHPNKCGLGRGRYAVLVPVVGCRCAS